MLQKTFEQSWQKLESALGDENKRTHSHRTSKRSLTSRRYPNHNQIPASENLQGQV